MSEYKTVGDLLVQRKKAELEGRAMRDLSQGLENCEFSDMDSIKEFIASRQDAIRTELNKLCGG